MIMKLYIIILRRLHCIIHWKNMWKAQGDTSMKKVYNEDKCTTKEEGGLNMQPSDFVSIYCEIAEIVGIENT